MLQPQQKQQQQHRAVQERACSVDEGEREREREREGERERGALRKQRHRAESPSLILTSDRCHAGSARTTGLSLPASPPEICSSVAPRSSLSADAPPSASRCMTADRHHSPGAACLFRGKDESG